MMERKVKLFRWCLLGLIFMRSAGASCPNKEGWIRNEEQCLELSDTENDWKSANGDCKKKSGRLVTIGDDEQQEILLDLLRSATKLSGENDKFWIGAHIPALVFRSYFNQCIDGYDFRNQSCFQILPDFLEWKKAQETCQKLGGKLASIVDEDTNKFLATAMTSMVTKHNIKSSASLSYWIDGYSDGKTLEFFDSRQQLLTYTNFMPSTVQNGSSCLEVFPEKPKEDELGPEATINATAAEMYADMDNLSTLGIPDAITQTTVVSYSSSSYSTYETNTQAPLYNILDCNEKRLAVCEFSLLSFSDEGKKVPLQASDDDGQPNNGELDNENVNKAADVHPSYLFSCKHLAHLSYFAKKMKVDQKLDNIRLFFSDLQNGYYIIKTNKIATTKEENRALSNNDTTMVQYELEYCDIDQLRSSIKSNAKGEESLQLFSWPSIPIPAVTGQNANFAKYNSMDNSNIYKGACVYMSVVNEKWRTSQCSVKYRYVCEYSLEAIKKHYCEDNGGWCETVKDNLQDLNEESKNLLNQLKKQPKMAQGDFYASALTSIQEMVSEARDSVDFSAKFETTENSVRNFTKNIIEVASIVSMKTSLVTESPPIQNKQRKVIDTVNNLGEYAADALGALMRQDGDIQQNITRLSVSSEAIKLQILVVRNETSKFKNSHLFDSYLHFNPTNGEAITMTMSDSLHELSDIHGVSFFYVQYKNFESTLLDVSENALTLSDNVIDGMSETDSINNFNYDTSEDSNALNDDGNRQKYSKGTTYSMIASNILTATLRINGTNYPTDVELSLLKKIPETDLEIIPDSQMCAFLSGDDGTNLGWSSKGCHQMFRLWNDGRYHCKCNHTTDFAVLMLVFQPEVDILQGHRTILSILALIGHILTIICLLVSVLLFIYLKREIKSDRRVIHVNLFLALLLAHIILVISSWTNNIKSMNVIDDDDERTTNTQCIVLTFFSHFLLLSAIFWMLVEGIVIYRKIVVVLSRQRNSFSNLYYVIGWGVPVAVATICICVGLLTEKKYNSSGCWLSVTSGMIWAFAAPAILVLVANAIIMILVLKVAMRTQRRKVARLPDVEESARSKMTRAAYIKTATRGIVVLTPLLGFTWMCGLIMFHVTMAYIFVLLNAFQGVFIFGCYCVCNQEVRTALATKWKHYKARQFSAMTDDRPLNEQRSGSKAKFITNRLFMRLSFSVTSSRQVNIHSLSPENSSSVVDKSANDEQKLANLDELSPMSSPDRSRYNIGNRKCSVSTHSTSLSHQSLSLTSLRSDGTSSRRSRAHLRKMTSRVRPLSSAENNKISLSSGLDLRRPMSADAVLSRDAFGLNYPTMEIHDTEKVDVQLSIPVYEIVEAEFPEQKISPENSQKLIAIKTIQETHIDKFASDKSKRNLNPIIASDDNNSNIDIFNAGATPTPVYKRTMSTGQTNSSNKDPLPNMERYNLHSREYYKVFSDDIPVPLYSHAWTRKMKPTKRRRVENKNQRKHTPPRTSEPCGKRSMSATSSTSGKTKRKGRKSHSARSDSVSLPAAISRPVERNSSEYSRPNSGDSKDSGIHDDVETIQY
ncbi:uncharacterized protein LOC120344893 isoform X2 [Styela clava]